MRVKEAMEAHNQTWATLSSSTGKTSSSFIQVANGNPTIGKLKETADAIGCHWLEFFTDEIDKEDVARIFGLVVPASEEPKPEEQPQADQQQEPEQKDEKQEPALTADVAFICPHCHEAIKLGFVK